MWRGEGVDAAVWQVYDPRTRPYWATGTNGGGYGKQYSFTSGSELLYYAYPVLNRTTKAQVGVALGFRTAAGSASGGCTDSCRCGVVLR